MVWSACGGVEAARSNRGEDLLNVGVSSTADYNFFSLVRRSVGPMWRSSRTSAEQFLSNQSQACLCV